ncbi:unnamed protein product [Sphacelaria rigidula]
MPPPRLREASAGSDLIGCHSAVLDVEGRLFTWGVGVAAGHGSARLVVVPTEVKDLEGGAREGGRRSGGTSKDRVKGVSCGGGFTLAVTNGGKVFSWGSWARGRLGLGRPPERTTGRHKRVPRFQAKPRRIVSIGKSPVVQVAAGDWHGMALTAEGEVYTWGHNASGQLGFLVPPSPATIKATPTVAIHNTTINSTSVSDMLRSSWTPVKLPQFGNQTASPKVPLGCTARDIPPATGRGFKETPTGGRAHESVESHCAVHIACGSQHSIVVDSLGAAWTWGGEGRSFLGHGETGIGSDYGGERAKAEAQARAMGSSGGSDPVKDSAGRPQHSTPSSFVPLSRERDISRSTARRALVGGWAEPRPISCLAQPQPTASALIVAAAAGRSHTILMTAEGRMFVFGEGAAVAGASPSTLNSVLGVEGKETGGGAAGGDDGVRGLVKRSAEEGAEDPLEILSAVAGPTPVPREACCSWLPALATRRIGAVACGGTHTIVLLAGDHIGYSLGMNCFRHAMGAERRRLDTSDILEREEEVEDSADGWGDGGVDCELLVAGSYLHAHRVILARRSPVLRDMIAQEERPGDGEPLQLLLPDLRVDVARALLEFLYTGDLRRPLDLDSALPYDLRAAARSYGIPRLEALCAEAISLGSDPDRQQGGREWGEVSFVFG